MAKKPVSIVEEVAPIATAAGETIQKDFQAAAQAERGPTRALVAANPYTALIIAFAVGNLIGVFLRV